jgi:hypothetical protein
MSLIALCAMWMSCLWSVVSSSNHHAPPHPSSPATASCLAPRGQGSAGAWPLRGTQFSDMPLECEYLVADVAHFLGLVQSELLDLEWGGGALVADNATAMATLLLAIRH